MRRGKMLLTALITVAIAWGSLGAVLAAGWGPKLGIDLQGGFSVILTAPEGTSGEVLDKAVEIMRQRIENLGSVQEPEISVLGDRNIQVQLPGVQDRERALEAVGTTGRLSFRPVLAEGPIPGVSPLFVDGTLPPPPELEAILGDLSFPDGPLAPTDVPANVDPQTGLTINDDPTQEAWLADAGTGIIYHVGPAALTGVDIVGAEPQFGGAVIGGGWVVDPQFSADGAIKFENLTADLTFFPDGDPRRRLAIVVDDSIISAPQVAAELAPGEPLSAEGSIITVGGGDQQETEAKDLATILQYGALPAAFERSDVRSVSASLGSDSLSAGLIAGLAGLGLVAVAMVAYYRLFGLITILGLSVFGAFLLLLLSLLSQFQGLTLTLAGVTGIIVSIGITSDSYIVFFERVKEEVKGGRPLRSAVDHGFQRAFRTILTADTVSVSAAILLWALAIGPVKGFAITLGLATMIDVVVAYYFTRPLARWLVVTKLGEGGALSMRGAMGRSAEEVVA